VIVGSLFAWIFSIGWLQWVISIASVIIFGLYIIVDTSLILGKDGIA